jgi:hypothetical protein
MRLAREVRALWGKLGITERVPSIQESARRRALRERARRRRSRQREAHSLTVRLRAK